MLSVLIILLCIMRSVYTYRYESKIQDLTNIGNMIISEHLALVAVGLRRGVG